MRIAYYECKLNVFTATLFLHSMLCSTQLWSTMVMSYLNARTVTHFRLHTVYHSVAAFHVVFSQTHKNTLHEVFPMPCRSE